MFYLKDVAIFGGVLLLLGFLAGVNPLIRVRGDRTLQSLSNVAFILGYFALYNATWFSYTKMLMALPFLAAVLLLIYFLQRKGKNETNEEKVNLLPTLFRRIRNLRGVNLALVLYLFFVFALTFLLTLAPPSGSDYDSLTYHLAAPAQYIHENRFVIRELPYDHHSYFPFTMEMLYALGLLLSGPVLAKLFHWLMLPLCCAALFAMARRHASTRAGLFAAAIFASFPLVLSLASTAYIELGFTFFTLLAFACFLNWREGVGGARRGAWLGWSGAFCGFALGTKYLGALTFFWLGIAALFVMLQHRRESLRVLASEAGYKNRDANEIPPAAENDARANWKGFAAFGALAILLGGFWYVRNIAWTGNPVFPFAYGLFGGRGWTAQMAADYDKSQAIYGFGKSPLDLLLLPFRLAMSPLNVGVFGSPPTVFGIPAWPLSFEQISGDKIGLFDVRGLFLQTFVGPLLFALGIPALFLKKPPRAIKFLGWSFAFFFFFWAMTSQQIRYLLPALALLCAPCGFAAATFTQRGATLKYATFFALAAWLLFAPLYTWNQAASTREVVFGRETPDGYLGRTLAAFPAMKWASEKTPPKARFAVFGEPRTFYLRRDYFWADDAHNNLIDYEKITGADALVSALRGQNATHILWNSRASNNGGFGNAPPFIEEALAQEKVREVFESRGYRVFEIAK